jgi:hypothetical protein
MLRFTGKTLFFNALHLGSDLTFYTITYYQYKWVSELGLKLEGYICAWK